MVHSEFKKSISTDGEADVGARKSSKIIGSSIELKPVQSERLKSVPYSLICQLTMTFHSGDPKGGSGFLVGSGQLIATAGHNLLDPKRGQPKEIAVSVGGKPLSQKLNGESLKPSSKWLDNPIVGAPYDYGFIIPPVRFNVTFGLEPSIARIKEIKSARVLGYPVPDERVNFPVRHGTLYEAEGKILGVDSQNMILYDADTIIGMSGCPLCSELDGIHKALGIHVGGTTSSNKAVSFNEDFAKDFAQFNK